jgi:hypothetical protein
MNTHRFVWAERALAVVVAAVLTASVWALTDVSAEQSQSERSAGVALVVER